MRLLLIAGCLALAGVAPLRSAPGPSGSSPVLERTLKDGLLYFRLHSVPGDLPAAAAVQKHPCILDLRYAQAATGATTVLAGWLKFHASTHEPVFALVNEGTAPAVLAGLGHRNSVPGLLIIGVAGQPFAPDITVEQSPDDERRAYRALETGTSIAALTTDHPNKQRNDEASLARDREADAGADGEDDSDQPPAVKPPSPPIDAALQMALDLHRGLSALHGR
ncbi:MAG TPA: hypothetical protein VHE61_24640 [Opitutaceae bacterium]|nr:hypothetical protein [Opitutaceae bacterium]